MAPAWPTEKIAFGAPLPPGAGLVMPDTRPCFGSICSSAAERGITKRKESWWQLTKDLRA